MTQQDMPIDLFRTFLTEKTWEWTELDACTLRGMISGGVGSWGWLARSPEDGGFLSLVSTVPLNVPRRRRILVMEYLTRANWGMNIGTTSGPRMNTVAARC